MERGILVIQSRLRLKRNGSRIGGPLWHTVDDRRQMVLKLNTEFVQVHNEAMYQMGWRENSPKAVENDTRWAWYKLTAMPVFDEWQRFKTSILGSWTERFTTNWDVIESWQRRLQDFRKLVSSQFNLTIPEAAPLTKTMWQEAGDGMRNIGAGVAGTLKTLLYIAVIGVVAIGFIFVLRGGGKTTAIAVKGLR